MNGLSSWELTGGRAETRGSRGERRAVGRGKTRGQSPVLPPPSPCQLCLVLEPRYSHLPHSRAPGCRRTPAGRCHTAAGSAALRRGNKVCKGISEDLAKAGPSALFPRHTGVFHLRGSRAQAPLPHGVCAMQKALLTSPSGSFTFHPSSWWGELLVGESLGLPCTLGFLGTQVFLQRLSQPRALGKV